MTGHEDYLEKTVELAETNIQKGCGPFACIIVDGEGAVLAQEVNRVTLNNDPTAHAEILAIRSACEKLQLFQLEECTVYASCEPCPMCRGALMWARPKAVYFAARGEQAERAGFDDKLIVRSICAGGADQAPIRILIEGDDRPFIRWRETPNKINY